VAYRADIEIAVRGAQQLKRLKDEIAATSKLADSLNNYLENIGAGGVVRSINNLQRTVNQAAQAFESAALGTKEATLAAKNYAAATRQLNAGLEERVALLKEVNEQERIAKLARSGIRERTQYGGPIGPGPASPVGTLAGQKSPVEERVRRTLQQRQEEIALQQGLLRLEEKSAQFANEKIQSQQQLIAGTKEVLDLIVQQNQKLAEQERRAQFLAGKSGALQQGPLAGTGAMGFPVALPTLREEQKGLETAAQKQRIIERTLKTRRELSGLAANLQRLETRSVVAISDAVREQTELTNLKREALEITERELRISRQGALTAGRFSPIGGAENIPGSPAFLSARRTRRRQQASGVALGAGFPLLFGGGPGAVLGGAAGGLVGGPAGFAAQIALSAIGQQFDQLAAQAVKVGQALSPLNFDLSTFASAAGIAGTETVGFLEKIEQFGGKAAAAKAATELLAARIGTDATNALKKFGDDAQKLGNQLSLIFTTVLANIARIAGPIIAALAGGLERANLVGGFKQRTGLTGRDQTAQQILGVRAGREGIGRGAADAEIKRLGSSIGLTGTTGKILEQAKNIGVTSQRQFESTKITGIASTAAQLEAADKLAKTKASSDKAAEREQTRIAKALINQKAITLEVTRQSEFSAKIAAAELAKDPITVRRLQAAQDLAELGVQTAKQLELEKSSVVQLAIARTAQAKAAFIRQKSEQDIAKIEKERADNFRNTLRDLDYELEIKYAVTEQDRERLRIEAEIARLREQNIYTEEQLLEIQQRKQGLAAPVLGADLIRKEVGAMEDELRVLSDTGTQVISIARGIGNAFGAAMKDSVNALVTGTKTIQQVFADFLNAIAEALLSSAAQMIATYVAIGIARQFAGMGGGGKGETNAQFMERTGNLDLVGDIKVGGFANGGYPPVGQASLVGENGPELFVPGRQGLVVPNDIFAATRAALNKGGDSGSGAFEENAQALAVSSSYTRERVMERERQTMLTGAGGSMLIQTEVINNVEYATVDQVAQAAAASAKQARAQVFSDMRNKPSTRASLGMR
jgi:hypothetical protein